MTTKQMLKTSGLAALAAAMAVSVLPEESFARDNDRGNWSQRSGGGDRSSARSSQPSPRAERSSPRSEARADRPSPRVERSAPAREARSEAPRPQSQARANYTPPRQVAVPASRVETRADRGSAGREARESWSERRETVRAERAPGGDRSRTYTGRDGSSADRSSSGNGTSWADRRGLPDERSRGDRDRDGNWNGRDRDGDRDRDGNWRGRDGNRDGNWSGRDRDRDHHRWDRRWRDNNRYDWHGWRDRNRTVFHLGLYYAPYRNYSYSRIGVGFYLDSLFFGSRYWIDDPWQYRLPEVYGPYRWVRYYDDVLLVDIYSGEVVDVIYDFFW